jgi:hypothetical protein
MIVSPKDGLSDMPTIAYFLGIAVHMYFNDHEPPHFHVRYQGFRARVLVCAGEAIDGRLPRTVSRLVKEWTHLHQDALLRNWDAARSDGEPERIGGLE